MTSESGTPAPSRPASGGGGMWDNRSTEPPPSECCLTMCFRFFFSLRKLTLCWISLLFVASSVLATVVFTLDNYARTESSDWILVGGVTSSSATFRVRTKGGQGDGMGTSAARRLVVSETPDFSPGTVVLSEVLTWSEPVQSATATDLRVNSTYYYATVDENDAAVNTGTFRTLPSKEGTPSDYFKIATAGCAWTGSKSDVFDRIAEEDPLLMVHLGDFHYEDISEDDLELRIRAVDKVLESPSQRRLLAKMALVYMWDDHDYLGNDSGGYGPGRQSALEAYRLTFPVYDPLPAADGYSGKNLAVPPYHAFTVGTVRFVVSDLRSEAVSGASIYSDQQREWLYGELANASLYDFVVWVTTKPWIGQPDPEDDAWPGFPSDRADISDRISASVGGPDGRRNLLVMSSDMHGLAFDDGSNTYYGGETGGSTSSASFPILQSGPLDRLGSAKGGPFTAGCHAIEAERNSQYSTVEFFREEEEEGSGVPCLRIKSYRVSTGWGGRMDKTEVLNQKMCGDIFGSTSGAGSGSCSIPYVSNLTYGLLGAAGALGILSIVVACCHFDRCEALKISCILILAYFLTMVAGIGIPFAMGVEAYETAVIALITLLLMVALFLLLLFWARKVRKAKKEEETNGDGRHNAGGAADGEEERPRNEEGSNVKVNVSINRITPTGGL